jgi:hypothetical protein
MLYDFSSLHNLLFVDGFAKHGLFVVVVVVVVDDDDVDAHDLVRLHIAGTIGGLDLDTGFLKIIGLAFCSQRISCIRVHNTWLFGLVHQMVEPVQEKVGKPQNCHIQRKQHIQVLHSHSHNPHHKLDITQLLM